MRFASGSAERFAMAAYDMGAGAPGAAAAAASASSSDADASAGGSSRYASGILSCVLWKHLRGRASTGVDPTAMPRRASRDSSRPARL